MSLKENERAIKTLEEEIGKSRGKIYQLERADVTDIDSFKALSLERQYLESLEIKKKAAEKQREKDFEEARNLTAKFETLTASLAEKFEKVAQPFIERLTDYLEGDLREEFIEIYSQLEELHSEAERIHNRRETVKGGSGFGIPIPGPNQFTFNVRVAKLLDTWEYKTRNEMIRRSKEAREAMKK